MFVGIEANAVSALTCSGLLNGTAGNVQSSTPAQKKDEPCDVRSFGYKLLGNLCKDTMAKECADVDIDNRLRCGEGIPGWKTLAGGIGCLAGFFRSIGDLVKFLVDIASSVFDGIWKTITHPVRKYNSVVNGVKKTNAQIMSVATLGAYVADEVKTTVKERGIVGAAVNSAQVIGDVIQKVSGPFFSTIMNQIYNFIGDQNHKFKCYNEEARQKMFCSVITDFLIPPGFIKALLMGGVKTAQNFPKVLAALSGIGKKIADNSKAVREACEKLAQSSKIGGPGKSRDPNQGLETDSLSRKDLLDSELAVLGNVAEMNDRINQIGIEAFIRENASKLTPAQQRNLRLHHAELVQQRSVLTKRRTEENCAIFHAVAGRL